MNSKVLTLVLVIFGLLLAALLTRNGDLAWMALPFLAYLGMGILRSPSPGKIHLQASRSVKTTAAGEAATVEVSVTVSNQGEAIHQLCLSDPLQPGMQLTGGQLQRLASVQPGEELLLQYTFQARRGRYAWETVRAVASDPLGLVETGLELPAEAEVQVQPELKKLRLLPLRPQRTLHSAGSIPARLGAAARISGASGNTTPGIRCAGSTGG